MSSPTSVVRAIVVGGAAVLAAACGGGGGGSGGGDGSSGTGANYFPVDANARWVYTSTDSSLSVGATSTSLTVNDGLQTVAGRTGQLFRTSNRGASSSELYVVSDSGVRDYLTGDDPITAALSGIPVMVFPIEEGAVYEQIDTTVDAGVDLDGDGVDDKVRLRVRLSVVGFESVTTPVAKFANALHQHQQVVATLVPSGGSSPVEVRIDNDSWYVDRVGLVRSVTKASGGGDVGTTTDEITGYRVGAVTTDATAPTIGTTSPAPISVRAFDANISATFSEPMDAGAFTVGAFTVTGANGPVAGTLDVEGAKVIFQPAQWLPSGDYTATVQGSVTDLLGNALGAPRSWTFTADGSEPTIASSTPADGAKDVPVDTSVVMVFNEPLDPATVSVRTVLLNGDAGGVPVTVALSGAGSTLTLTPKAPLEPAMQYRVMLNGVTDLVGNIVTMAHPPAFRTTQGRFAYPVDLPRPANAAFVVAAIGDVNGDGIADVVLASTGTGTSADGVYLHAGRADGTLAAPTKIDIGSHLDCFIESIAIGDLDGDGRSDLAIGGNFCGVQVLHQTASGTLAVGEFLNLVTSDTVRIADLDGNGRNVLLGVGGGIASVTLWRRDGTGTMVFSESIATGSGPGRDVQVGDVNGDGLADIVVATQGSLGRDVAVLRQGPGHVFATPTYLDVDSVWGARAVAVGDIDGDGRPDVVATTGGNGSTAALMIYRQDAAGGLSAGTKVATDDIPSGVRIADLDGDGRADIVVSHDGFTTVGVYLQGPDGTLTAEQRYAAPYGGISFPDTLVVGDVTNDGRPDIIAMGALIRQVGTPGPMSLAGRSLVGSARASLRRAASPRPGALPSR